MQQIVRIFPTYLRENLEKSGVFQETLEEIRVRINQYLIFRTAVGERFLRGDRLVEEPDSGCYLVDKKDLEQMCTYMSRYSIYAFEEEMKQGFLTIEGGHRVGIGGQVSVENGKIRRIFPVCYLNIRVAREHIGCSDAILPFLFEGEQFLNTLIVSPPGVGKTTLLRDLIRNLSDGTAKIPGKKVGLVDERSEIAGSIQGIPQNNVGMRTDVLDGCPKAEGMMILVRSMSPEILAVDEIGGKEDLDAMKSAFSCGCQALATIHCNNLMELWEKPGWEETWFRKMFSRYVIMEKRGEIRNIRIFDNRENVIYVSEI